MNDLRMTNVFKKILDQSTEMVFLVEKTPPFRVVFENRSFREFLGMDLKRMCLSDFGLDKEELSPGDEITVRYDQTVCSFMVGEEDEDYFIFQNGRLIEEKEENQGQDEEVLVPKDKCSGFYKNLVDKIPNSLFQMNMGEDGQLKFKYFSDGGINIFNDEQEPSGEVKGVDYLLGMVYSQDVGKVLQSLLHSTRVFSIWNCTFRLNLPEREHPAWIQGVARPEEDDKGEINWYGCLLDISAYKEREIELENTKNIAEKASRVKSEFISMITHDIRTPLNTISGSVFSLLGEEHNSAQEPLLNTISFAVDNLIIMVNDLLDIQKIEAGKIIIESKPFNLKHLLEQVVNSLKYQAQESKNALNLIVSDAIDITVLGDSVRLSQVMNNLITNALKFTKEGRVDVTVTMVHEGEKEAKVYFEVKDTGVGIAEKDFKKVFAEFDQVTNSFDSKYGGTGLGMPITKKLLENMGSQIHLESEVGKGSNFYFEINFEKYSAPFGDYAAGEGSVVNHRDYRKKIKVLLAEDNDVNAIVIMKIIRSWGYSCDRVCNGEEAIAAVFEKNYDIILMDIQMPVIDGFKATKAIKENFDIPIIALTAASKKEVSRQLEESKMDGFVSKPINALVLQKNIDDLIQHHIS